MSASSRKDEAREFLETLFGDKDERQQVVLFLLPEKRSASFVSLEEAAEYGTSRSTSQVYVHAGLTSRAIAPTLRCKAADIERLPALWADIDIAGGTHKKLNLPPDEASARSLLDELPVRPSVVVHSGGGLQAWWRLREPLVLSTDAERAKAQRLTRRFHGLLHGVASRHGWTVDATHDLARVLRLPGTLNLKEPSNSRPVKLLELDESRCIDPSELEPFFPEEDTPSASASSPPASTSVAELARRIAQSLRLVANAQPPFDKFQALCSTDERVQKTWDKQRRDLESASEYDLAMANLCVRAGWSDQESADLLVAMRRKHGADPKLRPGYYGLTLAKARLSVQEAEDIEEAFDVVERTLRGEPTETRPLDAVNRILESSIAEVEKLKLDPPEYRIVLKDGRGTTFLSRELQTFAGFERRYFELADAWIRKPKRPGGWPNIRKLLAQHVARPEKQVDMGPEALEGGAVQEWLAEYLTQMQPKQREELRSFDGSRPWVEDGFIYFRLNDFRQYVDRSLGIRISDRRMPKYLRAAGIERGVRRVNATTRSYWKVRGIAKDSGVDLTLSE